jgi:hypothetical protein
MSFYSSSTCFGSNSAVFGWCCSKKPSASGFHTKKCTSWNSSSTRTPLYVPIEKKTIKSKRTLSNHPKCFASRRLMLVLELTVCSSDLLFGR